jgi:ribonuclease HI
MTKKLTLYVDGGSRGNPGPSGGGFAVYEGRTLVLKGSIYFGIKTNNQAEYGALVMALQGLIKHFPGASVDCRMDSQLVVEQVNGNYKVKSPNVKPLFEKVKTLLGDIPDFEISYIPREKNKKADSLANEAMDRKSN